MIDKAQICITFGLAITLNISWPAEKVKIREDHPPNLEQ